MNYEDICEHCHEDLVAHHARNLRCPGGRLTIYRAWSKHEAIYWNPYNKVFQDHRDGTIDEHATNVERQKRGLPVPWNAALGEIEVREKPVF